MNLGELKSRVWDPGYKYFSYKGRISRDEFLYRYVVPMVAAVVLLFALFVAGTALAVLSSFSAALAGIVGMVFIVLYMAAALLFVFLSLMCAFGIVKRFHDFGVTGWVVLIAYLFGVYLVCLIIGLVIEGKPEPNKYGPPAEPGLDA